MMAIPVSGLRVPALLAHPGPVLQDGVKKWVHSYAFAGDRAAAWNGVRVTLNHPNGKGPGPSLDKSSNDLPYSPYIGRVEEAQWINGVERTGLDGYLMAVVNLDPYEVPEELMDQVLDGQPVALSISGDNTEIDPDPTATTGPQTWHDFEARGLLVWEIKPHHVAVCGTGLMPRAAMQLPEAQRRQMADQAKQLQETGKIG